MEPVENSLTGAAGGASTSLDDEAEVTGAGPSFLTGRTKRVAGATVLGAVPGSWMLWSVLAADVDRMMKATDGVPFFAEWLRGSPQSLGSVRMPSFYKTVMSTPLLLAAVGTFVALSALGFLVAYRVLYRRTQRIAIACVVLGFALVVAAPLMVRANDREMAKAFAQGIGSELEQLSGSCWFAPVQGDSVPDLDGYLRSEFIGSLPDGTAVVRCNYTRWQRWEREGLGLPRAAENNWQLHAFFAFDEQSLRLLGVVDIGVGDSPNGQVDSWSFRSDRVVELTIRVLAGYGSNDVVKSCERQLTPSEVSAPCD